MPDTVSCDPSDLVSASKCYCYTEKQAEQVMVYLLAQIAGDTSTPSELLAKSKCYCFATKLDRDAVITYLLCQIASG